MVAYTHLDHVRRSERKPLVQTDVLVHVGVEDLEVLHRGVASVLDVMSEGRGDVS